jgi:hypothetical protein
MKMSETLRPDAEQLIRARQQELLSKGIQTLRRFESMVAEKTKVGEIVEIDIATLTETRKAVYVQWDMLEYLAKQADASGTAVMGLFVEVEEA